MNSISTKKIVLNGLMIALVFLATYIIQIPTLTGYVNVGDAAIMIVAILLGKNSALIAGAIGSSLADMAGGYFIYAPITFIVKGLEGFVIGLIVYKAVKADSSRADEARLKGVAVGALIMIAGYFLAEAFILGIFNKEYGLTTAVANLLPNVVQGVVTAVLGFLTSTALLKNGVRQYQ
ncbi:MAG: ECF transporter S component [Bacillota bacterium]|nr:ECF transporter S component [Bacillota bacterium]